MYSCFFKKKPHSSLPLFSHQYLGAQNTGKLRHYRIHALGFKQTIEWISIKQAKKKKRKKRKRLKVTPVMINNSVGAWFFPCLLLFFLSSFCFCSRYGTSLQPIMITKVMNKNYYNKTCCVWYSNELINCQCPQNCDIQNLSWTSLQNEAKC